MIIKDIWFSKEYDKIRNNESIKDRIMFITLGGSYSYGTNVETSDIDVRGVSLNTHSSLIGLYPFEQAVCNETDTVIYSFNKLISLLVNCNPNTIELLGCKEDSYYFPNTTSGELGKLLLENKSLFLSKKAVYSFGGYANQQLRRLENSLCHDSYNEEQQQKHLKNTINGVIHHFNEKYTSFDESSILIESKNNQLVGKFNLQNYPVSDFSNILNELTNITREYEKHNKRNRKKDDAHLNKHAMHLIRLYLMCLDILEKGEINTYREKDREMLLEIRNGKYMNSDGTYRSDFFEMVNDFEKKLEYAKSHTELPEKPNMKKIEQLVQHVNTKTLLMKETI